MTKEEYLARITQDAERPLTPIETEAASLWYALLRANEGGYIDVDEWDNPFDCPEYIDVIVKFLESRDKPQSTSKVQQMPASLKDLDGEIEANRELISNSLKRVITIAPQKLLKASIKCAVCHYHFYDAPVDFKDVAFNVPTVPCPLCGARSWTASAVWMEE